MSASFSWKEIPYYLCYCTPVRTISWFQDVPIILSLKEPTSCTPSRRKLSIGWPAFCLFLPTQHWLYYSCRMLQRVPGRQSIALDWIFAGNKCTYPERIIMLLVDFVAAPVEDLLPNLRSSRANKYHLFFIDNELEPNGRDCLISFKIVKRVLHTITSQRVGDLSTLFSGSLGVLQSELLSFIKQHDIPAAQPKISVR